MAATEARADIVVTRYSSPDEYPSGISISGGYLDSTYNTLFAGGYVPGSVTLFTRGSDLSNNITDVGTYDIGGELVFGAEASSSN